MTANYNRELNRTYRISTDSLISHFSVLHFCSVSVILFPEALSKASLFSAVGCTLLLTLSIVILKGFHELRIDLEDFERVKTFAKYESFQILGESENYKLLLGEFTSGTAGKFCFYFPGAIKTVKP